MLNWKLNISSQTHNQRKYLVLHYVPLHFQDLRMLPWPESIQWSHLTSLSALTFVWYWDCFGLTCSVPGPGKKCWVWSQVEWEKQGWWKPCSSCPLSPGLLLALQAVPRLGVVPKTARVIFVLNNRALSPILALKEGPLLSTLIPSRPLTSFLLLCSPKQCF